MCRISITHTICIWGYHIFDSNFEHTLQLNLPNLLLCRKIGMGKDYMDTVKKKHHDDDTAGTECIECLKVTIPKQFVHLMNEQNKKMKRYRNKG